MKKRYLLVLATGALLLTGCKEIVAKPVDLDKTVLVNELSEVVNNTLEKVYLNYHDSSSFKDQVLDEVLLKIAEHEFGAYDDLKATDAFKLAVDKRAKEMFYKEVSSGSYVYRSVFDEQQFVVQRVYGSANSYIVDGAGKAVNVGALDTLNFFKEGIFLPIIDKDNFDDAKYKLVHIEYYTDYIREQFVDDIYRDKLVELYVKNEQSTTIGRNYAREIEYIAIANNSKHPTDASALVNAFIDNNILGAGSADLNILANAWRGVAEDYIGNEAALIAAANIETLYDDVLTDFALITDNPDTTDTSMESLFTGSGKYTKEVGLKIQKTDVRKQNFVTRGWGIKNGGHSALPETIRTRLFNIGVANGVDYVLDDQGVLANAGKVDGSTIANTFVRNIGGEYYLVPKTYEKDNDRNFLFFEGGTYYIVKIKEAVNTAKLATDEKGSYKKDLGRTDAQIAEIVDEVAYHLAQISSTKTNALNYFMKDITVVFHDETVKEFFEAEFPDVFGDDKKN